MTSIENEMLVVYDGTYYILYDRVDNQIEPVSDDQLWPVIRYKLPPMTEVLHGTRRAFVTGAITKRVIVSCGQKTIFKFGATYVFLIFALALTFSLLWGLVWMPETAQDYEDSFDKVPIMTRSVYYYSTGGELINTYSYTPPADKRRDLGYTYYTPPTYVPTQQQTYCELYAKVDLLSSPGGSATVYIDSFTYNGDCQSKAQELVDICKKNPTRQTGYRKSGQCDPSNEQCLFVLQPTLGLGWIIFGIVILGIISVVSLVGCCCYSCMLCLDTRIFCNIGMRVDPTIPVIKINDRGDRRLREPPRAARTDSSVVKVNVEPPPPPPPPLETLSPSPHPQPPLPPEKYTLAAIGDAL